ncbi:FMN-binding protein [Enterocloster clostridioformis]|uniref:FMN-binding protein n=1 Tax=Enterocloster clostridioformis TaxID=1531 RepID=UPI00156FF561|nr:FMN-binding protein [Enterocloster clostridioformis]NSJ57028.1 FMN-binding protein [Enterocloster clostridioformis]
MNSKLKKEISFLITVVITLFVGFMFIAILLRPQRLDIKDIDLNAVDNGEYIGICQNKILFAVVKVHIENHEIADIEILEHKSSYMTQAQQIADDVCSKQSLEVDAISGATLTSDTVLKAVENALKPKEK